MAMRSAPLLTRIRSGPASSDRRSGSGASWPCRSPTASCWPDRRAPAAASTPPARSLTSWMSIAKPSRPLCGRPASGASFTGTLTGPASTSCASMASRRSASCSAPGTSREATWCMRAAATSCSSCRAEPKPQTASAAPAARSSPSSVGIALGMPVPLEAVPRSHVLHEDLELLQLRVAQHRCQLLNGVLVKLLVQRLHLLEARLGTGGLRLREQVVHLRVLRLQDRLHLGFLRVVQIQQRCEIVDVVNAVPGSARRCSRLGLGERGAGCPEHGES